MDDFKKENLDSEEKTGEENTQPAGTEAVSSKVPEEPDETAFPGEEPAVEEPAPSEEADGEKEEASSWKFDGETPCMEEKAVLATETGAVEVEFDTVPSAPQKTEREQLMDEAMQELKKQQSKKRKKIWSIIGVCAAVIAVVFGVVYAVLSPNTAMWIKGRHISTVEYAFYYNGSVSNNAQQFASSYGLDTTKALDQQKCPIKDNDGNSYDTWADLFKADALLQLRTVYAFYDEAKKEKKTLSAEEQKSIDDNITSLQQTAQGQNMSLEQYFASLGYKGLTERKYRRICEVQGLASSKMDAFQKEYAEKEYKESEVNDYYNQNKDDFDQVNYRMFAFDFDSSDASSKTEAKKKADAMLQLVTDETSFMDQAAKNISSDESASFNKDTSTAAKNTKTSLKDGDYSDEYINWLFDAQRKVGDKAVVLSDSSYYVMFYTGAPAKDESKLATVRHILIQPETSSESAVSGSVMASATDAQKKTALADAEKIYKEWQDGKKTEDSFAQLAKKNSKDNGASENGGLYEDISQGEMVDAFDKWCFDASRKTGDSGIVTTDYGYHIMYYVSSRSAWKKSVEDAMRTKEQNEGIDKKLEPYKVKENKFGIKRANIIKTLSSSTSY